MTATLSSANNTKDVLPAKSAAIDRIHLDLDEMVNRLRREIWIGGILVVGTATVLSLLVLLVIDAIFQPESTWLRFALWLPVIGIIGTVTQRFLMTPLKQECDRLAMAWTLEQKRPAIEERLTTSLQLTATPNAKASSIIEAVAEQAHGSLTGCQEEDLRGQEVLRRTIVAGACFAAFVLSMWIWSPYLIPSLTNMLNPWSARVLPYLNATILPGNTHVAEGHDLLVTATANHLTDPVLEVIENDAIIVSHQMATETNGSSAEFTLMGLKSDRQYRVRSGGLYSDRYQIFVDPKPVIKSGHVNLTFPEYTQLPPQVINDLSEPIDVLHGTRVRIEVDATMPCAESSLTLNETSSPCEEPVLINECSLWRHSWEFTATTGDFQHGTITLVSEAGVLSESFPFEVRTLPDLPPSISVAQPALAEVFATPDQSITVAYHALDDFGCTQLHLITQKHNEPPSTKELPHDVQEEFTGELTFNLNELELNSEDQLTIWLSITDNCPDEYGGPQVVDSRKIRILIADEAASVGQQVVQNETQALLDNLTAALDSLNTAEQMADDLQKNLDKLADTAELPKTPLNAGEKAKQLQDRIKDAEQTLSRLSDQNEAASQPLFPQEIERIQEVADKEVAEAKKQMGLVPLSDDLPQQQEAVTATRESLKEAIDKLEEVREEIDQRGQQLELAAKLDELAKQQEQLAQEQQAGQENIPGVQQEQQQVADALQEVVEQDLDAKSEQFTQRAEEAAKLTETAAELQQQQDALAKLDQVRSQEELDEQLLDLIAKEQEQIANETRKLEEQAESIQSPTDARKQDIQKNNAATEAEQNGKPNALTEARKQMEAVTEELKQKDLKQAEAEAQQAGKRLQDEAESMGEKATAQPNANEVNHAQQQENEMKQLAKQQERVSDAIQAVREDRPAEAVAKLQEQIADRTERLRDKADELLKLPTDDPENQQAVQEAREKLEQAEQQTKAAEQLAKQKQKQASDPMEAAEQQKKAGDPKQVAEQQKQAAKSLQEATQSLESVCKSCKKCSKCNNPSASGGSSGGKPKNGGQQSAPKEGGQTKKSKPGSKQLAETADKAHQTARNPSPNQTQELAKDLNQLADEAAQRAGYPNRNSKPQSGESKTPGSSDSTQQAGSPQPGSTSKPQGVQGNAGADQSEVAPTQLRGRSTSNWTQSRRKLKNNVLDDQESKIPEEFRSVVKDYFEELSRLESRQDTTEDQE